ncbi:hypothetical protein BHE74_00025677 [Ensete ventricosum]|nr:hypothetical protein BHE74_00025677 [Ensete ventricosum]RZS04254.1 hypothetical protein BHM03_00034564 [Ensete ventricosum]
MAKHRGESSKMGQARPFPQAAAGGLQVGCKCKLALKLLETLMRSAATNKMSEKLGILCKRRRHDLECQPGKISYNERLTTAETRLDVLKASLEELYQGQRKLLRVESSQEETESRIDKVESN